MPVNYTTTPTGVQSPTSANTGTDFALGVLEAVTELSAPIAGCRLVRTSALSLPSASWTVVDFGAGSEVSDPTGMHDVTTNNARITIAKAGWYMVSAGGIFGIESTAGTRLIRIRLNGGAAGIGVLAMGSSVANPATVFQTAVSVGTVRHLDVGDYLTCEAYQDSGITMTLQHLSGGEDSPMLAAAWIGY